MRVPVPQKRNRYVSPQEVSLQSREHQQRQPGHQRDDEHASAHQLERIAGHVSAAQELEERPAQD